MNLKNKKKKKRSKYKISLKRDKILTNTRITFSLIFLFKFWIEKKKISWRRNTVNINQYYCSLRSAYKSCTVSSSACNPNFKQIHLSNQSVKIFPRTSPPQLGIPLSNAYTEFHYFDPRLHGFVSCSDSNRLCLFNCFVELAFPSFERIIMQSQCTTALPNNCNYPPKTSREISCPCILLSLIRYNFL